MQFFSRTVTSLLCIAAFLKGNVSAGRRAGVQKWESGVKAAAALPLMGDFCLWRPP